MEKAEDGSQGFLPPFEHFATQAIHVGQEPEQWTSMAVVPPISLSTTFKQQAPGQHCGFEYSRSGNPTRNCLEKAVAALDGAKYCLAYASGLAATVNIAHLLKVGDTVICMDDVYGGSLFIGEKLDKIVAENAGHSDVVMGLVSLNGDDLYERLKFLQNALGAVPSPFDCYLCNRGLKTLQIRMKQHFHNALAVAQYLESNPRVEKVIYPGLPSHPQHKLMKRQSTGCPGMVTFYIKGNLEHAEIFLKNLKLFALAESLGGYESLAEHPAIMTHASVPEEEREVLGISDTLIRLSVGLEDAQDILDDVEQALKVAMRIAHIGSTAAIAKEKASFPSGPVPSGGQSWPQSTDRTGHVITVKSMVEDGCVYSFAEVKALPFLGARAGSRVPVVPKHSFISVHRITGSVN
ncbi:Cystathionine gamma-lyase [Chelonia mydas]|uniref:Cystathionine gamma-lyase n=1 Tax=Chelonia mydas TaxID=8469 RepID=M7BK58_CHEMY|nr:Cystathionine gamma-lyase [Chelonia mydas]